MTKIYPIRFSTRFIRQYKKIQKRNPILVVHIDKTIDRISSDPFQSGLETHKANIKGIGSLYSTRVTGDIRIAWDFTNEKVEILAYTVGGHEIYN